MRSLMNRMSYKDEIWYTRGVWWSARNLPIEMFLNLSISVLKAINSLAIHYNGGIFVIITCKLDIILSQIWKCDSIQHCDKMCVTTSL